MIFLTRKVLINMWCSKLIMMTFRVNFRDGLLNFLVLSVLYPTSWKNSPTICLTLLMWWWIQQLTLIISRKS